MHDLHGLMNVRIFFQELKHQLTSASILTIPDSTGGFIVHTNASNRGLDCVMQKGKIVPYGSRKLKNHEQNYPNHDLELVVVILAL